MRQRDGGDADRHVDEEDPLPRQVLGEDAAEQQADGRAADGDGRPDARAPSRARRPPGRSWSRSRGRPARPSRRPRPCRARAAMSHSDEGASPFSSDAIVKTTTPATNTRRRPRKSAARPPSSRKPPKASVYALTTHWRELVEKSRSAWIDGSATFTTVASSTTMNWAMQTSTRTSQRRSCDAAPGGAVAVLTRRLLRRGEQSGRHGPFGTLDEAEWRVHFVTMPTHSRR